MFNKQDIAVLKGMFDSQKKDIIREVRDETGAMIAASENRLTAKIERSAAELKAEISQLRDDVIEMINEAILPQIVQQ